MKPVIKNTSKNKLDSNIKDVSEMIVPDKINKQEANIHKRKRRVRLEREKFSSVSKAKNAVEERKIWKQCASKLTLKEKRDESRGIKGQYRVAECPRELYLFYPNSNCSKSSHEAGHSNYQRRGLSLEIKNFIQENWTDGIVKPNALLKFIRQEGLIEPEKSKLVKFLKTLRHKVRMQNSKLNV